MIIFIYNWQIGLDTFFIKRLKVSLHWSLLLCLEKTNIWTVAVFGVGITFLLFVVHSIYMLWLVIALTITDKWSKLKLYLKRKNYHLHFCGFNPWIMDKIRMLQQGRPFSFASMFVDGTSAGKLDSFRQSQVRNWSIPWSAAGCVLVNSNVISMKCLVSDPKFLLND